MRRLNHSVFLLLMLFAVITASCRRSMERNNGTGSYEMPQATDDSLFFTDNEFVDHAFAGSDSISPQTLIHKYKDKAMVQRSLLEEGNEGMPDDSVIKVSIGNSQFTFAGSTEDMYLQSADIADKDIGLSKSIHIGMDKADFAMKFPYLRKQSHVPDNIVITDEEGAQAFIFHFSAGHLLNIELHTFVD